MYIWRSSTTDMNLQICKYDLTYLKICKYGSIICKHDIICKIRNLCRICRIKTIFSPFATPPHTTVSGYWGLRGTRTWDRKVTFSSLFVFSMQSISGTRNIIQSLHYPLFKLFDETPSRKHRNFLVWGNYAIYLSDFFRNGK